VLVGKIQSLRETRRGRGEKLWVKPLYIDAVVSLVDGKMDGWEKVLARDYQKRTAMA